jgi:hypothetical protein
VPTGKGVSVDKLVYLLPVLGCAAMMAGMVWMMRGRHADTEPDATTQEEIAKLRAEIAVLRAERSPEQAAPVDQADRPRG